MKHWKRIDKVLMACFVAWMGAGLIILPLGIGPEDAMAWPLPAWLGAFIAWCLRWGDAVLMLLAAANMHLCVTEQWGPRAARRWGIWCLGVGALVETVGTLTTFPFGAYIYTENFAPKLFGVLPFTIPLAWYVVVTGFLLLVRMVAPYSSAWQEAAMTAALATLFDFVMEPFAVELKAYWIWLDNGHPTAQVPLQNYVAWWVVSFLLVRFAAPSNALRYEPEYRPPILIFGILLLFLTGRIAFGV